MKTGTAGIPGPSAAADEGPSAWTGDLTGTGATHLAENFFKVGQFA